MLHLEQVFPASPSVGRDVIEAVAVGAIVGVGKLWDFFHGKKRERRDTQKLERISTQIEGVKGDINDVRDDVRDLRGFVIGPDGQNGLRGDVRTLTTRVNGLEDRERDRPRQTYDRRASQ
jgi:hypothetical protein